MQIKRFGNSQFLVENVVHVFVLFSTLMFFHCPLAECNPFFTKIVIFSLFRESNAAKMWREGEEYILCKNGYLWSLKASLDHLNPASQKRTIFTWNRI